MKVYEGSQSFKKPARAVVTMGTFDGVHLGHQRLLQLLRTKAREINGETVWLPFGHTPGWFLHIPMRLLSSF